MTKQLLLTKGKFALVDDDDFELVSHWHWYAQPGVRTWYAQRAIRKHGHSTSISLHRFLLNPPPGLQIDHINGDGLDCRRCNMRLATNQQNHYNTRIVKSNRSGYKGVHWDKHHKRWRVRIMVDGHNVHIGYFADLLEAASAYDTEALTLHGEFACTNFQPNSAPSSRAAHESTLPYTHHNTD